MKRGGSAGRAKFALIVAVSKYASNNLNDIPGAIIDAKKLEATLVKLGWKVKMALGLPLEQAREKIEEFAGLNAKGDHDCLVSFVGHGIEVNGHNYLCAADSMLRLTYTSDTTYENAAKRECLPFDDVLAEFKDARGSSAGVTVFVLDCCRVGLGPTPVGFASSTGRSEASSCTSRAPGSTIPAPCSSSEGANLLNSIVIYSTTSGNVADDGKRGKGGPFMRIFCEEIASGDEVGGVMKRTRKRVLETSCQLAPDNSLLVDDFFFSTQREHQVSLPPLSHVSTHS